MAHRRGSNLKAWMLGAAALAFVSTPAAAQKSSDGRKWDVEIFGGSLRPSMTDHGTGQLPAAGATFTVQGAALQSRVVPSWYFGDGALLLNQASANIASFGATGITPLDAVLTSFGGQRPKGNSRGFRFSKRIGGHYGLEIGFVSSKTPLALSPSAQAAFVATNASFTSGWGNYFAAEQARISNKTTVTNVAVSSGLTTKSDGGSEFNVTVAFKYRVLKDGPIVPYGIVGGGVMIGVGSSAKGSFSGQYQVTTQGSPKMEFDNLEVEYSEKPITPVIVYGAGVEGRIWSIFGWRFDFRAYSRKNTEKTQINANNFHNITPPPNNTFAFFTDPAIQVTNSPSGVSSLSGTLPQDTQTFTGTGRTIQTSITGGFFIRF